MKSKKMSTSSILENKTYMNLLIFSFFFFCMNKKEKFQISIHLFLHQLLFFSFIFFPLKWGIVLILKGYTDATTVASKSTSGLTIHYHRSSNQR